MKSFILSLAFLLSLSTIAQANDKCPAQVLTKEECSKTGGQIVAVGFNAISAGGTLHFCSWSPEDTAAANNLDLVNSCQVSNPETTDESK